MIDLNNQLKNPNSKESNASFNVSSLFFFAVLFLVIFFVFATSTNIIYFSAIALGIISIRIYSVVPAAFFVATLLLPFELIGPIFGIEEVSGLKLMVLHPAVISIGVGSFLNIIIRRNLLFERFKVDRALRRIFVIFIFFLSSIFVQTIYFRGVKGLPLCFANYFIPFCFFLYLLIFPKNEVKKILKFYVILLLAIALYGIFEFLTKNNFLYGNLYSLQNPERDYYIYRIKTTIGNALNNSAYFLFALSICLKLFKKPISIVTVFIFFISIFATGSRMAALLAVSILIFSHSNLSLDLLKNWKSLFISCLVIFVAYFLLFYSGFGTTLAERLSAAEGSAQVRLNSLAVLKNVILDNFVFGKGMGLSSESSLYYIGLFGFENPWLMLIVDAGFLTMLLNLAVFFITAISKLHYSRSESFEKQLYLAFIFIQVLLASYSSFGIMSSINLLVWFNIALLY